MIILGCLQKFSFHPCSSLAAFAKDTFCDMERRLAFLDRYHKFLIVPQKRHEKIQSHCNSLRSDFLGLKEISQVVLFITKGTVSPSFVSFVVIQSYQRKIEAFQLKNINFMSITQQTSTKYFIVALPPKPLSNGA